MRIEPLVKSGHTGTHLRFRVLRGGGQQQLVHLVALRPLLCPAFLEHAAARCRRCDHRIGEPHVPAVIRPIEHARHGDRAMIRLHAAAFDETEIMGDVG